MIVSMSPNMPVSPVRYAARPVVKVMTNPDSQPPYRARADVADVIVVRVREQHHVDIAESTVGLVDGPSRIVENAHAGRILEQQRAIVAAQLAAVAAERRHLDQPRRLAARNTSERSPQHEQDGCGDDDRTQAHTPS